jgi:hypothetical protein
VPCDDVYYAFGNLVSRLVVQVDPDEFPEKKEPETLFVYDRSLGMQIHFFVYECPIAVCGLWCMWSSIDVCVCMCVCLQPPTQREASR